MHAWQKAVGILGLVTASYATASTLGAHLPRPAWTSDLERLAADLNAVKVLALQQALESTDLRRIRIKGEIEQYRSDGKRVPEWLLQEERKLDRRIRAFEREMESLR